MREPLKRLIDISAELVSWVLYAIALPLSPMVLALFILSGHGKTVSYEELFGGTEVFLLCITVFATTHVDLERSKIAYRKLRGFSWYFYQRDLRLAANNVNRV